jgi:ferric-dicitrate binding protein FerR (iron transport regulator)
MNQNFMNGAENDIITSKLVNYLSGKATEEEISQLEDWINSSSQNRDFFLQVKNLWEISGTPFNSSDISTEEALEKVIKITQVEENQRNFMFYLQRIAAILIIPLMLGGFLWGRFSHINRSDSSDQVIYNEVFAAYGTRSTLKLADGTKVWLNSGSSLSYPVKFINQKRIVKLKGEAYFEVQSDVTRPFIVKTQSVNVMATGTKFNVQAFSGSSETEVTLLTGKVLVNKKNKGSSPSVITTLKPNQHLVYDSVSGNEELRNEDVYKYIAWKDGKLIFRNESLGEIVKKICQLYNVDIEMRGKKLEDFKFRATFQDESLEEILRLLKLSSPIDYREIKRNPLPDGSFAKKKIIIFSTKK